MTDRTGDLDAIASQLSVSAPRVVARALSLVESESSHSAALLNRIHGRTGRARIVGVTGPPGAGKSTLVDRLIAGFRASGRTVAVLAVDPTSPFTGGALLGDRVRMQTHAVDGGVFVRSMATRGHLGGLSRATHDAASVFDAAGFDIVIIETVGVGQDEVEIAAAADVTVVVVVPGAGDDVQALKAGIMEIADLFVVNKADRDGAEQAAAAIEAMLSLAAPADGARPMVLRTVATTGDGIQAVIEALGRLSAADPEAREVRRRARLAAQFDRHVTAALRRRIDMFAPPDRREAAIDRIARGEQPPSAAAETIVSEVLGPASGAHVLDHVGIATADASALLAFLGHMELVSGDAVDVSTQRVRVRFVETGTASIEIVEPSGLDSPLDRFLQTRGPGLHHLALRINDIEGAIARLKAAGLRMIDDVPRPGAHGTAIAFVHPSSTGGVLVELVQRAGM